jgi:hypothetical protein
MLAAKPIAGQPQALAWRDRKRLWDLTLPLNQWATSLASGKRKSVTLCVLSKLIRKATNDTLFLRCNFETAEGAETGDGNSTAGASQKRLDSVGELLRTSVNP